MKKRYSVFGAVFFLFTSLICYSQINQGGSPLSFENSGLLKSTVVFETLPKVDVEKLISEDAINDLNKEIPWRFGENIAVNYNPDNSGVWDILDNGDKLWRLGIRSAGAFTINLTFDKYHVPPGAKLFVYNEGKTQVIGAFTDFNNQEDKVFATTLVSGDAMIIEYFEPSASAFSGELNLNRVTHGYRDAYSYAKAFGESGACNNNVNCPEAAGWENQIRSACMLVSGGNGFCSGSLVNNTSNNGIPYVLTANHCYSDPSSWVFWYNWQSPTCANPGSSPAYNSMSGATLKARYTDSDFCLVQMNTAAPASYNVYYVGWNREDVAATSGVGIHHPAGDIKKISYVATPFISGTYSGTPAGSHWQTNWSDGVTEGGSSGSPIFDQNHRVVGQLHGGPSYCGATQLWDFYGKFSMSWDQGTTPATRLKDWLDPTNTGEITHDGFDPNLPVPTVATLPANPVTPTTATLNGTVNPNGHATSYYFEWGTTISYGNATTTQSAGSGTNSVPVLAPISGLTPGATYHFRIAASNSFGISTGVDMVFTPGAAGISTTAASAITTVSATSGGTVLYEGGSAVTARGVCWGVSANPVITGNHTTDGAGPGTFISAISGLNSNTTYHVRAYATNGNGTFYGDDLTFTTLCGIVSSFPWNEGFENNGLIPNCWTQEQVNSSGVNWAFITGNGSSNPATAHSGTFNACLKDASSGDNKTRLISPTLNLASLTSPVLKFWHTQALWSPDQDVLTVYYRVSATGAWTQLATYTSSITSWTEEIINLPNGSSDYYINFEGNAKYGYGVCIDDVSITGTSSGPTLSVTPVNQNVTAPAGTTPFTVTSNSAWTAVSNQSWCTVTPSGTGNGIITATYTQNIQPGGRVADISVNVSGLSPVVVTVTQAGSLTPTLSVTPPNQNVTAPAGATPFTVTSNSPWTVASNQAWCTVTPSGSGNGTITAAYTENLSTTSRVANVTVTVTGIPDVVVTVTQAGSAPVLSVTPLNQNVASPGGFVTFNVTSNLPWTVSSNMSWCVPNPASGSGVGSFDVVYEENTSTSSRVATLTVTGTGISPVQVTVTQEGAVATLNVTPPNQNVTTSAGVTDFTVTSNTSWIAASNQPWCAVTPSGTGNGTIVATYMQNVGQSPRQAIVTVNVSGIAPVDVTVSQEGLVGVLEIEGGNLILYPNPNEGKFIIASRDHSITSMTVKITDLRGKEIKTTDCSGKERYAFDLSNQAKGSYLVRISTNETTVVQKIIVE
jgi:hypothetical protein